MSNFTFAHKIKKFVFFLLITSFHISYNTPNYSIIFVHIGTTLPSYLQHALTQAQLFNPEASIYLVANKEAIVNNKNKLAATSIIYCEDLPQSKMHKNFIEHSTLNNTSLNGFWKKTTERFFYLDECIRTYNLKHVFHLESDNMLYADLSELLPIFKKYKGIAAVFDNDHRCIPSFMYMPTETAMPPLVTFISKNAKKGLNDMEIIALYKNTNNTDLIDGLPIMPKEYTQHDSLQKSVENSEFFSNHIADFNSLFDGAALGQYLGGIDYQVHKPSGPGFINESCIFNASKFKFIWISDNKGRKIPYIQYHGKKYRINNLHIHSKDLHKFKS